MGRLIEEESLARTLVAHKRVGWFENEVEEEMQERVKGKDYCTFMAGYEYGLEIAVIIIAKTKTAYDVEKVVEQIGEMFGVDPMYYGTEARWAVDKAIELVRKGGVENG